MGPSHSQKRHSGVVPGSLMLNGAGGPQTQTLRFPYDGFDDEGNVAVSPTGLGSHEHLAAEPSAAPMLLTCTREEKRPPR